MAVISSERRKLLSLLLQEKGLASAARQTIPRRKQDGPVPLSFAQQRMWFLDQFEGGGAVYNIPLAVRLQGELKRCALESALAEVIRRHEALRTTFTAIDGQPVQIIGPACSDVLPFVDLRGVEESRREVEAHRIADEEAGRAFDLERGPVMRATLLCLGQQDHVALLNMHHIVSDAWSRGVLVGELGKLYERFASGRESELAELPIQYADYSVWQREWLHGEVLDQQLSYWKNQLKDVPAVIDLPLDHTRPAFQTSNGSSLGFELSLKLSAKLKELGQSENATLFMVLLAGLQALLYRYTRQDHVAIGTPMAGRHRAETEGLIGLFINTLVLHSEVRPAESFISFLRRVKSTCLGAFAHQDIPFEKLVDELHVERSLSYTPLFQVMFMLQNTPRAEMQLPNVTLSSFGFEHSTAKFDLLLGMEERGERMLGSFEYNTDLFERSTIKRLSEHFERLLHAIVENPEARVSELSLLSDDERSWLQEIGSGPVSECETGDLVHRLFEQQAARTPEATAIVGREFSRMNTERSVFIRENSRQLSYGELNRRANRLAHYLRRQGVGVESRVGVLLERNVDLPVALLAVLKTGAAYVPLDPAYPEERLRFLLADAAAQVLITSGPVSAEAHVVRLDELDLSGESEANLEVTIDSQNLSHVIYTSGSTGQPKGVMVTHGSTCELLRWARAEFSDEEFSSVLFSTSVCFDLSVFELFAPLAWGGCVVVVANALEAPVTEVQLINTVPTAMTELLRMGREVAGVTVNLAGEALPERLVQQLHERGVRRVCNLYGPTEDTTYSTWTEVGPGERVTLGRALQNTRTYVLDQWQQPVPVGVVGELYLGGAGLARGYHNRGALTAERFVPDPFSANGGERLYRTGDLVKYLGDGRLEYLGRRDQQVKLRGYRIELGEVETVLGQHPQVWETVVVVRSGEASSQLVAYVVGEAELNTEELRSYVRERLPEYMVPQQFVQLDQLPQTPNGKVDRKALPAPETRRREPGEQTAARSWAEQVLSEVWQEVLRVEGVGVDENFFELGGDSILSIQMVSRAAGRGLRMTARQVFQHQTIAALAAAVGGNQIGPENPARATRMDHEMSGPAPLTPIQRWFFEQVQEHREHWNQAVMLRVKAEDLNINALQAAFDLVRQQHPALRLSFKQLDDGSWQQRFTTRSEQDESLTVVDLGHVDASQIRKLIEEINEDVQASLDLTRGTLMRAVVFDCGENEDARLLALVHHLAVDGVSWRVLLEDWQSAYEQLQRGTPRDQVTLLPEVTSYTEWASRLAEYARNEEVQAELKYWTSAADESVFEIPLDEVEGENLERDTSNFSAWLTEDETHALLREVPGRYRTEINDALLTALGRALWRWTGDSIVEVDLEGHGREELADDLDVTRTVGWFTTLYPVVLEVGGEVSEDLKAVKERLRAIPRRGLGYGLLRSSALLRSRQQLVFNYLGQLDGTLGGESMFRPAAENVGPSMWGGTKRTHLLVVNSNVVHNRLLVVWSYSSALHRRETIAQIADGLMAELRALIAHCREEGAGGFTPSDFPAAQLSQAELDDFLASVL